MGCFSQNALVLSYLIKTRNTTLLHYSPLSTTLHIFLILFIHKITIYGAILSYLYHNM